MNRPSRTRSLVMRCISRASGDEPAEVVVARGLALYFPRERG